jgi:hypothetical protein
LVHGGGQQPHPGEAGMGQPPRPTAPPAPPPGPPPMGPGGPPLMPPGAMPPGIGGLPSGMAMGARPGMPAGPMPGMPMRPPGMRNGGRAEVDAARYGRKWVAGLGDEDTDEINKSRGDPVRERRLAGGGDVGRGRPEHEMRAGAGSGAGRLERSPIPPYQRR